MERATRYVLKICAAKNSSCTFIQKTTRPDARKKPAHSATLFAKFKKLGIEVFGVSLDSEKSHQKFAKNTIYRFGCSLTPSANSLNRLELTARKIHGPNLHGKSPHDLSD